MQAGLTNVMTMASGCGSVNGGSYNGLIKNTNIKIKGGHGIGHDTKSNVAGWTLIVQHNAKQLVRMMEALETIPEGNGNMMDNTLIIFMSDCAEAQHSRGGNWPILMLGNLGGAIKHGRYYRFAERTLNSFYTTLLHAIGAPRNCFNMDESMAKKLDGKLGPIGRLLA